MSHGVPKAAIAVGVFISMFAAIGAAFWYQDLQYSIPTPKPAGLQQPPLGASVEVKQVKPKLLHFYNPDCPCSQFNTGHLRELIKTYGDQVEFQAVLQSTRQNAITRWEQMGLGIPAILDEGGKMATKYGVYSTPQAVLVDGKGQLYFRGNYNLSRYCTDKATEFARIALDSLTTNKPLPKMQKAAMTAYGCSLPEKS